MVTNTLRARRVVEVDQYLRSFQWRKGKLMEFLGYDVHHEVLGIWGMGRIRQGVASQAKGFGMKILYTDRSGFATCSRRVRSTFCRQENLLAESDFVTLHVPLVHQTTHYISTAELALMKPTAILAMLLGALWSMRRL
jgi:gluconate 2-dehydrogenase